MTALSEPLPTRFDVTAAVPPVDQLGAVHVLAVGGAGMSAVARLLVQAGRPVTGADAKDSEVLAALAGIGVGVSVGHDAAHLDGVDTVVVSSAIRDDNVELVTARGRGLRVLHRSQALAATMWGRTGVAIAGANGKTTTTSMLASALLHAGEDPSYAIGGELMASGTNAALGDGPAFIVEADESDGSFLVYHPDVAIVTNVQPDHLDFYGTYERVEAAYAAFVDTIRPGGLLVTCADDPGARRLAEHARRGGLRVRTYGVSPDADLQVTRARFEGLSASATLRADDGSTELSIRLPGAHNLLNAAAAYLAATEGLRVDPARVLAGLADFRGVRRRFEVKGEAAGVRVVDDYAHNPGKVAAVVSTAVPLARPGRLVAAFQPHLYSRTRDFAEQFGTALAQADVVVVLGIYAAREDPMPGVSSELVSDVVRRVGADRVAVYDVPRLQDAAPTLAGLIRPGDLVVTIGAGDITGVGPELLTLVADGAVRSSRHPDGSCDATAGGTGEGPAQPAGEVPR